MHQVFTEVEGLRFTEILASDRSRVCMTFIMPFESHEEKMEHLREAELFFDRHAISNHKLKGMPTVLLNDNFGQSNRVVVRTPTNVWVEVTNASAEELSEISMGNVDNATPAVHIAQLTVGGCLMDLLHGHAMPQY